MVQLYWRYLKQYDQTADKHFFCFYFVKPEYFDDKVTKWCSLALFEIILQEK